jgi:hypothetical protein
MVNKIIYFLMGVSIATFSCFSYFSGIIEDQNKFIASDFQKNLNLYKGTYSDDALPLINANNLAIQRVLSLPVETAEVDLMRLLLTSSTLLNAMTLQDRAVKENIFLTTAMFYKKTDNEEQFEETMTLLKESCEQDDIMTDCSESKIREILRVIK